jgi:general secretion pathway protein C
VEHRELILKWLENLPAERLSRWFFWGLMLLACQQLASLTWGLLPHDQNPSGTIPTPAMSTSATNEPDMRQDIRALLQLSLFGRASVQNDRSPASLNAPRTHLNLTLTGILASSEARRSQAIIISAGDESGYAIGETVVGTRARLVSIQPDRVILDNAGQNETLMLDGETYKPVAAESSAPDAGKNTSMSRLRDELLTDPSRLLDYVHIEPRSQDGQLLGYALTPVSDNADFFRSLGLVPGDVVIGINGMDLRDKTRTARLLGQLSSLKEFNLIVLRDGQPQDINVNLAE